jgi:hypothetical protein
MAKGMNFKMVEKKDSMKTPQEDKVKNQAIL